MNSELPLVVFEFGAVTPRKFIRSIEIRPKQLLLFSLFLSSGLCCKM